ncbi:hypothetical protein Tco_1534399, partial [Tanacetum coccineum]
EANDTTKMVVRPPVVCDRKQRKRKENAAAAAVDLTPLTKHPSTWI